MSATFYLCLLEKKNRGVGLSTTNAWIIEKLAVKGTKVELIKGNKPWEIKEIIKSIDDESLKKIWKDTLHKDGFPKIIQ